MRNSLIKSVTLLTLLLTLGVGQLWAWSYKVYCVPKAIWGDGWTEGSNIVKVLWKTNSNNTQFLQTMSKTAYTYEGDYIYEYTIYDLTAEGADKLEYQRYSSADEYETFHTVFGSYWGHDGFENKIFRGEWNNNNPVMRTYGRDITFYAVPESMDGSLWNEGSHSLYADIKYGDSDWKKVQMTKTAYNYNENPIYTCTTLIPYNVIKQIKFYYNDGSDHELYNCNPASQYGTDDIDGKIFLGWKDSSHKWVTYGRDVTVYTIPDYLFSGYTTPYNESDHYPAVCVQYGNSNWKTTNMTKTSYTYDSYPIYTATFLLDYNIFKEYQIKYFPKAGGDQVGLYQFNTGGSVEYAPSYIDDKLYHGWNGSSHDFFDYTYDVTLDQQSGSGGDATIKATDGAAMPAATMPGRDGYIFGGYWTAVDGGGTQYYDADGSSTQNWDSRTITTLYAKWTARNYTITLEGMEATTHTQTSVTVTFDASTNMTSAITKPTKTNYTFDGYWTDNNNSGATLVTQLIDEDGNWKKDISPYTGLDGSGNPTWIYPNDKSLFAKWIEKSHTVTVQVSAGTYSGTPGTVQISSLDVSNVTAGEVTWSAVMTPIANPGWKFKEWQKTTNVDLDLTTYHSDYQQNTDNSMRIKAYANGETLTAVFEPRYTLVGEIYNGGGANGGMPGMSDYTVVFPPSNLTLTRELLANTKYQVEVHDLALGANMGRSGCTIGCVLAENTSLVMENQDNVVFLNTTGAGNYIFNITDINGSGHVTLTVLRPHQMHMGHKRVDIDGNDHSDNIGGSLTATTGGNSISNNAWFNYGADISFTASTQTGYDLTWYSNDSYSSAFNPQPAATWDDNNVTHDENVYAKFTEKSTSVTLANDGNGKVQIGGADATSTTCGVTTHRELTAVAKDGYMFSNWSISGDDISLTSTSTNPTTLSGRGTGATSGQTVTANFTARYSIKGTMNGENWGTGHTISNIGTNASSKDTGYVEMTLPANTRYEFAIYDEKSGVANPWLKNGTDHVYDMIYGNSSSWAFATDKTYNCGIITAGKGTYKFIFNITDKTVTVVYPLSYQVNYGASVGGSVTSVVDGDGNPVANGGYVVAGGSVTYTAAAASGYTFVGWCNNNSYGDTFTNYNPWINSSIAATSNAYAKFKSTNFVIYRTGDMASDPRAVYDDVESYAGGTITETIEFRMKVRTLDQWYSLCLPFEVNAVQVWDEEDKGYYDIQPYYRTGGTYYLGHYIIRTPESTTNFPIANFDQWNDPTSPTGYKPAANTPYIIQWHNSYFENRYISFFGATGQTIPTDFSAGSAPTSENVVNVCTNNTMHSGSVAGAYMLEGDYGSDGAWLRLADASASRTVQPFECYILAASATTAKYRIIRRGMTLDETTTGWDDVVNSEQQTTITVYTLTGMQVTQYTDCSISEAAQRLSAELHEGLFILRSENESVKLMLGGK